MPDISTEQIYTIENFEGTQKGTNRFLKKKGELDLAQNASFDEVGSVSKKLGYVQRASNLTSTSTTTTSTSSTTTSTSTTTTSTSTTL
jgi:hypothetical protein